MGYIVPILFLVFATAFGGLSLKFSGLHYLRYFALAFLACGLGVLAQVSAIPADLSANSLVATGLYVSGALLFAEGAVRRSDMRMGSIFHALVFAAVMLGTAYFLFGMRDLLARVYILNFGFAFILLAAAWRGRGLRHGSVADKALFWTFVVAGLHFFPRTVLTAQSFGNTEIGFGGTTFWIALQYALALLSSAGGLTLLAVTGADILSTVTRERDTDALTGLLNRRGLESAVNARPPSQQQAGASVIIADLDNFKSINDTLGHAAGDVVLQVVADRLAQSARRDDLIARIGGEEFVFLITGTPAEARAFAERARSTIESEPIEAEGVSLNVTASFGVAEYVLNDSFWDAVRNADRALYSAKKRGKNTINFHAAGMKGRVETV